MSLRMSIIRKATKLVSNEIGNKTRFVTSRIGKQTLYNLLNQIDDLDKSGQELQRYSTDGFDWLNPSHYHDAFRSKNFPGDSSSETDLIIRGALYNAMDVFSALKYAQTKVRKDSRVNTLLKRIFAPQIVNAIAYSVEREYYVYRYVVRRNSAALAKIATDVYKEREKYITGKTIERLRISMIHIRKRYPVTMFFSMRSPYSSVREAGYYNRAMDYGVHVGEKAESRGINVKSDLPTLGSIYGWLKRRDEVGLYRPLVAVGWKNRNSRTGSLVNKPEKDVLMKPFQAAFLIYIRMLRRFKKNGRLQPFGSFAKYSKRNTIYKTTIFTEIFNRHVFAVIRTANMQAKDAQTWMKGEIEHRISNILYAYKHKHVNLEGFVNSLNNLVKRYDLRVLDSVQISGNYSSDKIKDIVSLAKKLKLKIEK